MSFTMETEQPWKLKDCGICIFTVDCWSCGATVTGVLAPVSSFDVEAPSSARTRGSAKSPEMKPLKMLDMYSFCWKEALEQWDSMELSDLCPPVTVLVCLASMLWSESTLTDVAWTQWLVRWGAIPADVDMFFIMFSSVVLPTGELQYHSSSFCGWNFVHTSLGHWNKACRLGFRSLRELSRVFTGQRFELETSNVFGRLNHRLSTMVCCSEAVLIIGRWLAGSL